MAAYQDADSDWLDGGVNYTLHVPPNVPAKAFWSMTVYNVSSRAIIVNETKQADRSSRMDVLTNPDGMEYTQHVCQLPKPALCCH